MMMMMKKMIKKRIPKDIFKRNPPQTLPGRKERRAREGEGEKKGKRKRERR